MPRCAHIFTHCHWIEVMVDVTTPSIQAWRWERPHVLTKAAKIAVVLISCKLVTMYATAILGKPTCRQLSHEYFLT